MTGGEMAAAAGLANVTVTGTNLHDVTLMGKVYHYVDLAQGMYLCIYLFSVFRCIFRFFYFIYLGVDDVDLMGIVYFFVGLGSR